MIGGLDRVTLILLICVAGVALQVFLKWRRSRRYEEDVWQDVSPEQRNKVLFSGTPLAYIELDSDGIVRLVNERECEIRGLSEKKILGATIWELAPATEQQKTREAFFQRLDDDSSCRTNRRNVQRPNGENLTLESYDSLLRDPRGEVVGLAISSLDITDRQRNEEEIFRTSSELKAIFQAFPDHFLTVDADDVITKYKPGSVGSPFQFAVEPVGKHLRQMLPEEAAKMLDLTIRQVRKNGEMVVAEYRLPAAAGSEHFEARCLPLDWANTILVIRNITSRRKKDSRLEETAQELEQKNRELEEALVKAMEATRLKSRFLANMSHEIRTPMNGVLAMTDFLLGTKLDDEQRDYAESVKNSANSLLTVINDILDISKIEAGKLQIERIPFELRSLMEEVARIYTLRARAKQLKFECSTPRSLKWMVEGDPGRLRQILNNLLGNALKFTEQGSITMAADLVQQSPSGLCFRFSVSDTGIGIAPDKRDHLFESFSQADESMSRKYGGTGLGLAISKQLVELMGGQIGVESNSGQGSVFWFTVTLGRAEIISAESPAETSLEGVRVLVFERRSEAAAIVKQQLPEWGMRGTGITQSHELLPVLRRAAKDGDPYKVVLIDMQMASVDGLADLHAIRSHALTANTAFVAMTSVPMRGDGSGVKRRGFSGYLVKPYQPEELREMIAAVILAAKQADAQLVTRHTISEKKFRWPEPEPSSNAEPDPSPAGLPETDAQLRALVAEDNKVNQKIAARLLQKAGVASDVVNNGKEAVDASERTAYDVILMDCQMPEMDGFEATAKIRNRERNGRKTPICALTAHAMKADREKCLASGMDYYLSKPVDLVKLQEALTNLIPKYQSEDSSAKAGK